MIHYKKQGIHHILNIFRQSGSVFKFVAPCALLCGVIAYVLKHLMVTGVVDDLLFSEDEGIMNNNAMWSGFSFLVGFLIVFRTSQAYARFWEGCTAMYRMRAEWLQACSAIIAFCKHSKKPSEDVMRFGNTLIRLFSMLHALALAEIEDSHQAEVRAFEFELVDVGGIDFQSLKAIQESESKVELCFQWIQQCIVENMDCGTGVLSIPPPILSRSFHQVANGMVAFQDAIRISKIPFPFPYAQTCDCLLVIHWLVTPVVVCGWFKSPMWAAIFTTITVFTLWVLNCIAVEIENPFGMDENDIDCDVLQIDMNRRLRQLLSPSQLRTPVLTDDARLHGGNWSLDRHLAERRRSFREMWELFNAQEDEEEIAKISTTGPDRPPEKPARVDVLQHLERPSPDSAVVVQLQSAVQTAGPALGARNTSWRSEEESLMSSLPARNGGPPQAPAAVELARSHGENLEELGAGPVDRVSSRGFSEMRSLSERSSVAGAEPLPARTELAKSSFEERMLMVLPPPREGTEHSLLDSSDPLPQPSAPQLRRDSGSSLGLPRVEEAASAGTARQPTPALERQQTL